jgi:hypothetical protein
MQLHNVFTKKEIEDLLDFFEQQPIANIEKTNDVVRCYNKNLDYQIPGSFCNQIVRPKFDVIIGSDHSINTGSYKEGHLPYPLHFDTNQSHYSKKFTQLNPESQYNCAVLIPLVESPFFKTVSFDIRYKENQSIMEVVTSNQTDIVNGLDLNEFDHINQDIIPYVPKLPVLEIFNWKIGDVFFWDRDLLHCSTNFQKHNLIKKFLIFFIA